MAPQPPCVIGASLPNLEWRATQLTSSLRGSLATKDLSARHSLASRGAVVRFTLPWGGDYACLKSTCDLATCTTATNSGGYEVETCTDCNKDVPTEVCAAYPVKNYGADPIADYQAGDVVRIGAQRYKVRAWPNALWAPNEAYKPCPGCTDYHADVWKDAWVEDGVCA